MANCIFCKIAAGEVPANKVYEDDRVCAFHDIHPQAPTHVLIIPHRHIASLDDVQEADRADIGYLFERVAHVARLLHLEKNGYRILVNIKEHGGQEVFHIHVHLFGGQHLGPMLSKRP